MLFYVNVIPVSNKTPSLSHAFLSPRNFPLLISLSHPFHPKEPKKGKCLDAGKRPVSLRQRKILKFIDNRIAEWGSTSNFATAKEGSSENNGGDWFMSDVSQGLYAEQANTEWQDERPVKQQKLDNDEV